MSKWQFKFPPSRTCLWDKTPTGESTELHITRSSWPLVYFSFSALQLAVRHAKQSPRRLFDCFLIATAWTSEEDGVALEVDRFDPGRPNPNGSGLIPTILIPGDIAIPSQVTVSSHPDAKYLTHNLATLHKSIEELEHTMSSQPSPLDPAHLLSLRIHCTCSEDGELRIQCGCIYPAVVVDATPINPITIVQTALARNLSSPLSLSAIQGKIKYGYITMESSRKLILLLQSDPKATHLPLVGIWVSGISSLRHPMVWTACVEYTNSTTLSDRVWGEGGSFLMLVYLQGSSKPVFTQCIFNTQEMFEMACGESTFLPSPTPSSLGCELLPVQESSAVHTLLESVLLSRRNGLDVEEVSCDLVPLPSPHPTLTQIPNKPTRDSELSMLSCLSLSDGTRHPEMSVENRLTDNTPKRLVQTSTSVSTLFEDKENVPTNQLLIDINKETSKTSFDNSVVSSFDGDNNEDLERSLVVFPGKQQATKPQLQLVTPKSETRHLLKQQENQLRVLQEQVNSLLQAQSMSPVVQSPNAMPTAEASTSTGESLYWPRPSLHSRQSPTPSQGYTHQDTERDDGSVCCSSIVSIPTAASVLSQNISDIHLDLHSYAHSPCLPQSPPFGDSASVYGGGERDASPASLLVKDQQQFYQNMLCQVNALLSSQKDSPNSQDSIHSGYSELPIKRTSSQQCSFEHSERGGTPGRSKSVSDLSQIHVSHHSSQHEHTKSQELQEQIFPEHGNNSSPLSRSSSQSNNVTHSPVKSVEPVYLHSEVLQPHYYNEVSMLPVPRIVCPILTDSSNSYTDTMLFPKSAHHLMTGTSADCTLDENMQLADMIAMKYIGSALPTDQNSLLLQPRRQFYLEGTGSILDTAGSAHMSVATKQYLQRHHLLGSDGSKPPINSVNEGGSPTGDNEVDNQSVEGGNILNIQRLKMLPKLI